MPYINGFVNPAYANLPLSAREIPEKRSEKAAVFQIGTEKYAAISFGSPLFTDVNGQWLPIEQSGRREGDFYIFDRLAEGIDISFDLRKPQYTLMQNGQGFTVTFSASATGRIIDDRSVEYVLADGAILTWTVNGNHVHKEILIEKYRIAQDIAFTIAPIGNLHLQENNQVLSLVDDQEKEIFVFTEPFLAKADGAKLHDVITLKNSANLYQYSFDESALPLPYIIDPSSGPNSPGTIADIANQANWTHCSNIYTWTTPSNAAGSDNAYATHTSGTTNRTTTCLKATNFGFSIPTGATIDGVVLTIEHNGSSIAGLNYVLDDSVYLVKGGIPAGSNNADLVTKWPTSDTAATYGSASDLWGTTLTYTDVNASDFGATLNADVFAENL